MDALFEQLSTYFENPPVLPMMLFIFNGIVLLFSKAIVKADPRTAEKSIFHTRLWTLRAVNLALFTLNVALVLLPDEELPVRLAESGIVVLLTLLSIHYLHVFAIRRFGRTKDIEGEVILSETYASGLFALIASLAVGITAFVVLLNIWEATDWLQATSAFGALLVIIYTTKDVWLSDAIHGLILLYQKDTEPGTIIRIEEENLLAVIIQITLTHTVFRDLRQRHRILMPNVKVRNAKLEVLNADPNKSFIQFVDYNLAYGIDPNAVEAFFEQVMVHACDMEKGLDPQSKPNVLCLTTGDHAVTWRVAFHVRSIYRLVPATCAFNRAAYTLSIQHGIGLDTPITHRQAEDYTRQPPFFPDSLSPSEQTFEDNGRDHKTDPDKAPQFGKGNQPKTKPVHAPRSKNPNS